RSCHPEQSEGPPSSFAVAFALAFLSVIPKRICFQHPTTHQDVNFPFPRHSKPRSAQRTPMRIHPLLTVAILISTVAAAQTRRPMTFEDMMQMRRLGSTDVSPDGKWLLYSVTSISLEQNTKTAQLWIQPIAS